MFPDLVFDLAARAPDPPVEEFKAELAPYLPPDLPPERLVVDEIKKIVGPFAMMPQTSS